MNQITMKLQADHLILEALKEDISSEDVTTNSVMKEAVAGEVDLICKQDGIIAGLELRCGYLLTAHRQKGCNGGCIRRLHELHISQKYAYSVLFFLYRGV